MLKIGDFSKLSQVTVKALRLYDQLGLLKPIYVDEFTSYRYYCAEQLPRLNRILALKDLGFSLEQIAKLLDENVPSAEIRGMLRLKQAELQRLVEEEQARLLRVEARLKQIEEESIPKYEIVLKKVEPIKVASIREVIPNFAAVPRLYDQLFDTLQQQGIQEPSYCAGIWHDSTYKESDVDWEAVASAESFVSSNKRVKVYELLGFEKMACAVHHGSYDTSNQAYAALISWIEANGYKIIGSNREVYIIGGNEQNNESYVTEIQFPVARA
ncbi:MerR family transcriptional regulator [Chlorogloeopsis fritschii PCC 9212]|uniref:MerR family transcriptional regulator n=1 Tax=Chlorogloeopsis fritschii PCC 6912 TaxID=211165 RepID=A0A433MYB5_CHLFR|nr:MerR family transcriptional regulator [Chlorogloeopsis fritschii]RUR73279.1 MerR family transcriptional regulator [Chlorogloeopsis fritschii PCC 6912]